ncbi:hypothetical protein ASZ78_000389, partial [Callipepla squamata]
VLPEHMNYQLQDTDFQTAPYCQYSSVQIPSPVLQSQPSQSQYSTYSLDSQYSDGQYVISNCELSKPPFMACHLDDSGFQGLKRPRLNHSSLRLKGQEELCVVCGDKASGYHYNALTCEGCKGLLTEVQCKSKRLRKNFKPKSSFLCNIKLEDEGLNSKHVSSTTRSGKTMEKVELTPGEHQLLDHIVAAHQKYTIPLEEARKFLQETTSPEESFLHLSESAVVHVQVLVDFTKRLPGHIRRSEHAACCHAANLEKNVYAIQTSHSEESPTSTTTTVPHNTARSALMPSFHSQGITEEFITALFYFYRSMGELKVTETEYALLVATTVLFSDRPLLRNKRHVEELQEPFLGILYKYSKIHHPEDPQHFARLIGRLTQLRTLNHSHAEVLVTWRTKDPRLTALLCEVWELH